MYREIIILGIGGNSIDILDTINDINHFSGMTVCECKGFLDDNNQNHGKAIDGKEVLGPLSIAKQFKNCLFVNGIGRPLDFWKKEEIINKTGLLPDRFTTIVHPTASVSPTATLGCGVVVFQNVTIASHVNIGNHVIILPNTVISHDAIIDNYTCIAGGVCISGGVKVSKSCYIGTNAAIIANVTVGEYCLIGMGSIVLNNVENNSVVVGNPARFLRKVMN